MRVLPDHLRDALKEPIGLLVDEEEFLQIAKQEKHLVAVGDRVTYTLLKNHIEPVFCVVDFKTRRGECSSEVKEVLQSFGKKTMTIQNPAGSLSDEMWNAIKKAYNTLEPGSLRIEVDGEEDLAALAAIYLAPHRDVTIIYGLPNRGVVVVKAIDVHKRKVKEILDKM
jgi:uncharacterized protein (UPF0218 family)